MRQKNPFWVLRASMHELVANIYSKLKLRRTLSQGPMETLGNRVGPVLVDCSGDTDEESSKYTVSAEHQMKHPPGPVSGPTSVLAQLHPFVAVVTFGIKLMQLAPSTYEAKCCCRVLVSPTAGVQNSPLSTHVGSPQAHDVGEGQSTTTFHVRAHRGGHRRSRAG